MRLFLRKIHRWSSLFVVFFLIFYCLSGVLLNHKRNFKFLKPKVVSVKKVVKMDPSPIVTIVNRYLSYIPETEKPRAIVIDTDGTINILYGDMKKLAYNKAYIILPKLGILKEKVKKPVEPLHFLKRFHKSYHVNKIWIFVSDILTLVVIVSIVTGLFITNYKGVNLFFILLGLIVLVFSFILLVTP